MSRIIFAIFVLVILGRLFLSIVHHVAHLFGVFYRKNLLRIHMVFIITALLIKYPVAENIFKNVDYIKNSSFVFTT